MAIDTQCPHCAKRYRLKDELTGKTVRCQNPECRKTFPVPAKTGSNGTAKPAAPSATSVATTNTPPVTKSITSDNVPKSPRPGIPERPRPKTEPRPKPVIDADTLALEALREELPAEESAKPVETRTIAMVCVICDHHWTETWDKQGKNIICPECRHRQKVPEQKQPVKADWRNPNANRPSLARSEEPVPDNVMGGQALAVSVEALEQAGVIEEDIEARPRWHYVAVVLFPIALIATTTYAALMYWQGVQEERHDGMMSHATAHLFKSENSPLPPEKAPLFHAAMHLAAGEHALRHLVPTPEHLKEGREQFVLARSELKAAPRSWDRDAMFTELALAQLDLGGTEEQVLHEVRIPWLPSRSATARIVVNEPERSVQQELLQTLIAMRDKDKPCDFDVRLTTVRRLTRELAHRGQPDLIFGIVTQGFYPGEQPEALAACALELRKHSGTETRVKQVAADVRTSLSGGGTKLTVPAMCIQALWLSIDPPITSPTLIRTPTTQGVVSDESRLAYTAVHIVKNEPAEALALATRPGKLESRLRALAFLAEWSDNPSDAIRAAHEATAKEPKPTPSTQGNPIALLRLARMAAHSGQPDLAVGLCDQIADEGLRCWTRAVVLRGRLTTNPPEAPIDPGEFEVPDDPKKLLVGHAWGRMLIARHNTRHAGVPKDWETRYDDWGNGSLKGFGLAGVALGLQDRAQ